MVFRAAVRCRRSFFTIAFAASPFHVCAEFQSASFARVPPLIISDGRRRQLCRLMPVSAFAAMSDAAAADGAHAILMPCALRHAALLLMFTLPMLTTRTDHETMRTRAQLARYKTDARDAAMMRACACSENAENRHVAIKMKLYAALSARQAPAGQRMRACASRVKDGGAARRVDGRTPQNHMPLPPLFILRCFSLLFHATPVCAR